MERYTLSQEMSGIGCGDIKYYVQQYEKMLRDKDNFIQVLQAENKELRQTKEWGFKGALYDLDRELYQQIVVLGKKPTYTAIRGIIDEMLRRSVSKSNKEKGSML